MDPVRNPFAPGAGTPPPELAGRGAILGVTSLALQSLSTLRSFAAAFKVSVGEIKLSLSESPAVLADSGNLEVDLPELLLQVAQVARAAGRVLVVLLDEVQYLSAEELRSLIVALHRAAQKGLPVILFGAGLPQVAALAGEAKSYAERLFAFPALGPLSPEAAAEAVREPVEHEGAALEPAALAEIVERTQGYPYFLQEWGKHAWNAASSSPITLADVRTAHATATAALDQSFFRVRFDRLTPKEKDYLRAMASLGPGPHRSGAIAAALKRKVEALAPLRTGLIRKGMIWSPAHGQTAFTVPIFHTLMRRVMPDVET